MKVSKCECTLSPRGLSTGKTRRREGSGWVRSDGEEEAAVQQGDEAGKNKVHKQGKFVKKLIVLVCSGFCDKQNTLDWVA